MISELDIQAKSDEELLGIWANQNDYIGEVITCVKVEIERRKLDVSGIHVPTRQEVEEAANLKADTEVAKGAAKFIIGGSALLLFQQADKSTNRAGSVLVTLSIVGIVIAIGVWRGKRWALVPGMVVCALVGLASAIEIIANVFLILASPTTSRGIPSHLTFLLTLMMILPICCLALCLIAAFSLNSLRKRKRVLALQGS